MAHLSNGINQVDFQNWLCPDLTPFWQLGQASNSQHFVLLERSGTRKYRFDAAQGYALCHFTGQFTVAEVQNLCTQEFGDAIPPDLVAQLLQKLVSLNLLCPIDTQLTPQPTASSSPQLKSSVEWIHHPDGYWILRNREDVTFLQLDDRSKAAIGQLGQLPLNAIALHHGITQEELHFLLRLLTATGMLEGTKPSKPSKGKFNPLQLLFFTVSLFNPDKWLTRHVEKLRFVWTAPFFASLCFFLVVSAAVGIRESQEIFYTGQQLWLHQGASLIVPFALLVMLVVSLHELGHAFTLKHYGGIVPDIGLLFMCLMPGCYTNTTDSYCLVKRRQRALVVGAGVLVQLIIWAVALWLWNLSNPNSWLHTASYLLMVAALLTVAVNLNPLSKFDGYYLAVAITGINNLRSRSFQFYSQLLRGRMSEKKNRVRLILAAYAPFSLAYTLLVFGHLLLFVCEWCVSNIPTIALILLTLWAIYFYSPTSNTQSPSKA